MSSNPTDEAGLLNKAADVLDERGWCQGAAQDPYGGPAVCTVGAICVAAGAAPNALTDGTAPTEAAKAVEQFEGWLNLDLDSGIWLTDWNDEWGRTADEVTKALRDCAADLAKPAAPNGPYATAEALQTLKPLGNAFARIVLREEIGDRAFQHVEEVTR